MIYDKDFEPYYKLISAIFGDAENDFKRGLDKLPKGLIKTNIREISCGQYDEERYLDEKLNGTKKDSTRSHYLSAFAWINGTEETHLFSFRNCCLYLSIDPELYRQRILGAMKHALKGKVKSIDGLHIRLSNPRVVNPMPPAEIEDEHEEYPPDDYEVEISTNDELSDLLHHPS